MIEGYTTYAVRKIAVDECGVHCFHLKFSFLSVTICIN